MRASQRELERGNEFESAKQSVVRISGDLVERDATPKPEERTSGLVLAQPMEFDGTHRLKAKQTQPRSE